MSQNFREGGDPGVDKKQAEIEAISKHQPTGDLLQDLEELAQIVGWSLKQYLTDSITSEQFADPKDPADVYRYYTRPEAQVQLSAHYDDPKSIAHVAAVKRVLAAYKEKAGV